MPPCPIQDAIAAKMDAAYRRKRELEADAERMVVVEAKAEVERLILGEGEV